MMRIAVTPNIKKLLCTRRLPNSFQSHNGLNHAEFYFSFWSRCRLGLKIDLWDGGSKGQNSSWRILDGGIRFYCIDVIYFYPHFKYVYWKGNVSLLCTATVSHDDFLDFLSRQTSLLSRDGGIWRLANDRTARRFVSLDSYPAGDTFPYWERENTGDPELFAQEYIDYCINNLYPDVGCPGACLSLKHWKIWGWNVSPSQGHGTALLGANPTMITTMITQSLTSGLPNRQ